MLELLMTVVSGGATGIIGSAISGVFKFLDRKSEIAERVADRAHEIRIHELNIQAGQAETESELRIVAADTAREQLLASYRHDAGTGQSYRWVSALLRLVRPLLTFTLLYLTYRIYFSLDTDGVVDGLAVKAYIINTIVYTTSAAVCCGGSAIAPSSFGSNRIVRHGPAASAPSRSSRAWRGRGLGSGGWFGPVTRHGIEKYVSALSDAHSRISP